MPTQVKPSLSQVKAQCCSGCKTDFASWCTCQTFELMVDPVSPQTTQEWCKCSSVCPFDTVITLLFLLRLLSSSVVKQGLSYYLYQVSRCGGQVVKKQTQTLTSFTVNFNNHVLVQKFHLQVIILNKFTIILINTCNNITVQ